MRGAVGYTRTDDSKKAVRMVVQQLQEQLGTAPDAVLCFPTVGHDIRVVLDELRHLLPCAEIAGCSVFGNATSLGCDESTFSLSVYGLLAPEAVFRAFVRDESAGEFATGRDIGSELRNLSSTALDAARSDTRLLWIFPSALHANCNQLFAGIESGLEYRPLIVGGLASNDYQLNKTFQFAGDQIVEQGVSGLFMSGAFEAQIGISHGSRPVGAARTITKARGPRILEIDGVPALDILERAVGQAALDDYGQLVNVIGIGTPFQGVGYSEDLILRAILGFDAEERSLVVGSELEEGATIYFTIRDPARVIEGTKRMVERVCGALGSPDDASYFYINCDGRGSLLFGDCDPDVSAMHATLGSQRSFGGLFCFGEISPVAGQNYMHSFTGILLALEGKSR